MQTATAKATERETENSQECSKQREDLSPRMKFILCLNAVVGETTQDVLNRLDSINKAQFLNLVHSIVRFDPHIAEEDIVFNRRHRLTKFTETDLLSAWPDAYEGRAYTRGPYYFSYYRHWHVCSHTEIRMDTLQQLWDLTYIYLVQSQGEQKHWHLLISFIHPKTARSEIWQRFPAKHIKNPIHTNFATAYKYLEYQAVHTICEGGDASTSIWRDEYHDLEQSQNKQAALEGEFGYDTTCYLKYLQKHLHKWHEDLSISADTPANARQKSENLATKYFFAGFVFEYNEKQLIGPFVQDIPPLYEGQAVVCVINASESTIQSVHRREGWFKFPVYIVYTHI
jgi:hypothetical protein